MKMEPTDHRVLGGVAILLGVLALFVLRIWASPIALSVTGRGGVSVLSFLAIPLFLLLVGIGIVLLVWGQELGFG